MSTTLSLSGPAGYVNGADQTSGPFIGYASSQNYVLRYSFKTPATGYVTSVTFNSYFRKHGSNSGLAKIGIKITDSATSHKNAGASSVHDGEFTPGSLTYVNGLGVYPGSVTVSGLQLAPDTTYYIFLFPLHTTYTHLYCYDNEKKDFASASAEETPACSTVSLSDAEPNMEDQVTISISAALSELTHTLRYTFGNLSGTIATEISESETWTVPLAFAKEIPDKTSGVGTIYCDTYHGTTFLGTTTAQFTARVPENEKTRPKVAITLSPISDANAPFNAYYIAGRTKVRIAYDASSEYSTIKSYSANVEGTAYDGNPAVSNYLSSGGSIKITATVTDARGYKSTATQEISVIPYQKPRVVPYNGQSEIICARCDADGMISNTGENLLIKAGRSYSPVIIDGVQKNFCQIWYRYKEATDETYSGWVLLLRGDDLSGDFVSTIVTDITLNVKTAYVVQVNVTDTLGVESNAMIPVGSVRIPFHLGKGKRNVAIGQHCDYSHEDALDIGFTTYFNTGIAKRVIFEGTWAVGSELGASVASADLPSVGLYTIFIAICEEKPVLCVKHGDGLYGSSLKMTLTESDGVCTLTLDSAPSTVTALYALM